MTPPALNPEPETVRGLRLGGFGLPDVGTLQSEGVIDVHGLLGLKALGYVAPHRFVTALGAWGLRITGVPNL